MKSFGSGGTFYNIKSKNGRNIRAFSMFPEEEELLLFPNSVFKDISALSSQEVNITITYRHALGALYFRLFIISS